MTPFEIVLLPQATALILLGSWWLSGKLVEATK